MEDVEKVEKQMTKQELEICITEYGRDIYSFCRHLTGNGQEAEDLYQDTFLKAVELLDRLELNENPKSYLLSIALRLWRNRKRKFAWRKRIAAEKSLMEEWDGNAGGNREGETAMELPPEEQILWKEKEEAVRAAVKKLPERLRIVVLLFYMEEFSTVQIAAMMKIPKGTVQSRLYQARNILRKELEVFLDGKTVG